MIYLDRGIPGADPLNFLVEVAQTDPHGPILLVLWDYSIYVVERSRWPSEVPQSEEEVARLATRRVLPLD
jgi:hypothetical protein